MRSLYWTTLAVAGAVAIGLLAIPGEAQPPAAACEPQHVPHLGQACRTDGGLYEVVLADGLRLRTHGPDPKPASPDVDAGFEAGSAERPLACADASRLEVLYGHPSGAPDRLEAVKEDIRAALRRMNAVLNADSLASGGPTADYRVACDDLGQPKVSSFTGPASGSAAYTAEYDAIVNAARSAGFTAGETDYLVFYDAGSTVCGVGNLYGDDSLSASNSNMAETGYGVVYDGCWFGRTPMHENGHTQGAVQDLATGWDGSGHCIEGLDVMCYPGEEGVTGTVTLGLVVQCSDRVHYDCGFDTYFDAAPEPGEWLATHWNIGSPLNRYLSFNGTVASTATSSSSGSATSAGTPSGTASSSSTPTKVANTASSTKPGAAPSPASKTGSSTKASGTSSGTAALADDPAAGIPAPSPWLAVAAVGAVAVLARRRLP